MNKNDILLWLFITLIVGMIIVIAIVSINNQNQFSRDCEARGGKPLIGKDIRECLDPKLFK